MPQKKTTPTYWRYDVTFNWVCKSIASIQARISVLNIIAKDEDEVRSVYASHVIGGRRIGPASSTRTAKLRIWLIKPATPDQYKEFVALTRFRDPERSLKNISYSADTAIETRFRVPGSRVLSHRKHVGEQ